MKNRTHLTSFLAAVISLSHAVLGMAYEVVFTTSEEVDAYVVHTVENIRNAVEQIVQIPLDEQTFDNTLRAWNRLNDEITDCMQNLMSIEYPLQDFQDYVNTEVFRNGLLKHALISYVQRCEVDETLNPFQRNAADKFLQSSGSHVSTPNYVPLRGSINDKVNFEEDISLLNFYVGNAEGVVERVSSRILDKKYDVVCFQEVTGIEAAYAFYDILKEHYAHFYIATDLLGGSTDPLSKPQTGLLIASKYTMDNPQYTAFSSQHGFIDFSIKDDEKCLGHVYVARLEPSSSEAVAYMNRIQLQKILDEMESHLFEGKHPRILLSDLRVDEDSEMEDLLDNYFDNGEDSPPYKYYALLMNSLSDILANAPEYRLESSSVFLSNESKGFFSSIKKLQSPWCIAQSQILTANKLDDDLLRLCKGSHKEGVSIQHEKHEDGKRDTEVRGFYHKKDGNNHYGVEAFGKHTEEKGKSKIQGGVQVEAGIDF
jgi:hypothetical protein